jgi:hypothetical protein
MRKFLLALVLLSSTHAFAAVETVLCNTCDTAHSAGLFGAADLWISPSSTRHYWTPTLRHYWTPTQWQ